MDGDDIATYLIACGAGTLLFVLIVSNELALRLRILTWRAQNAAAKNKGSRAGGDGQKEHSGG